MTLLYALLALNLAFAAYLFLSLRRNTESFWDKAGFRVKQKAAHPTRVQIYYDAFSDRQPQLARTRANTGQY